MNKKVLIGVVAAIVVAGGAFMLINKKDNSDNKTATNSTSQQSTNNNQKSAETVTLKSQTVGQPVDCSTYNYEELSKVWGVPFVDIDANNVSQLSTAGGKLYSCSYNQTNSGLGVTFSIEYREHPSVDSAKQSMSDTRSSAKYGDTVYFLQEEKTGVGDEAVFSSVPKKAGVKNANQQIYIRKGNVIFLLSGVNLDGVDDSYKDKLVASYRLHFQ